MMYNGPALSKFEVSGTTVKTLSYSCEVKSAIFHAAILTLLMSIAEVLVNLLITLIADDYLSLIHI